MGTTGGVTCVVQQDNTLKVWEWIDVVLTQGMEFHIEALLGKIPSSYIECGDTIQLQHLRI